MSAELLRRAAAKLREMAGAATGGPWLVDSHTHGDDDWVMWNVLGPTDADGVTPIPLQTRTEDAGYFSQAEADVTYAALMHPPVALALADLLDETARSVDARVEAEQYLGLRDGEIKLRSEDLAVALAREILREGGDSDA